MTSARSRATGRPGLTTYLRVFVAVPAILLGCFHVTPSCVVPSCFAQSPAKPGKLVLTMLEIPPFERGGGLAIVIQTPSGRTFLYDTGIAYPLSSDFTARKGLPPATADEHEVDVAADRWQGDRNDGRDTVLPWLKRHGITSLDGVAISHAHYDHFGGLLWLENRFPIKKLYDSGFQYRGETPVDYRHISAELDTYDRLRDRFRSNGKYEQGTAGKLLDWDPAIVVEVIAPPAEFFPDPFPEKRKPTDPPAHFLVNANSIGLRITHGDVVISLPGDVQAEDQGHSLLKSIPKEKLRCDVLIAPAHGIHADPQYAAAVRPKLVLCSVVDRFLPAIKAPAVYEALGAEVLVNSRHGEIRVESDGRTFTVKKEREGAGKGPASPVE